jgi:serine/threonine-protein kinase RsbW
VRKNRDRSQTSGDTGETQLSNPATRQFSARRTELDTIRTFVESACGAIGRDECQRIMLLIEELFANSVSYGYGGDSDEPVWVTVLVEPEGCRVIYEDCAPPHDPFAAMRLDAAEGPLDDRPIGRLGVLLLAQLSSRHEYRRRGDRNVIELEVTRSYLL